LTGTVAATNGGTGTNTTTVGDLLYGTSSNTWSKLALGAANKSLVVNGSGTQVEWNAVPLSASGAVSGVLPEANGGTNNSSYTTGDTLYSSAANTLAKLAGNTTTTQKFLSQTGNGSASAAPVWDTIPAGSITGLGTMSTQNSNAVTITGGNVALTSASVISVTDNVNAALRITQLGTGNALLVEDEANPDASPFVVNSSGTVLIGTTSSITNGVVATTPVLQEHGLTNNTSSIGLTNWSSTAARTPSINFNRSVGNAVGTRGALTTSGTGVGAISFTGDDGTSWLEAAKIDCFIDGTPGTNDMPGRLVFSTTADGASSPTERMRINSAGAVTVNSSVTAASFSGTGTALTALNASNISSGTIANIYTTASASNGANTIVARDASGNFTANNVSATNLSGSVTGSGAGLTSLNASAISSGTIANARTTAASANGASTIVARDASGNFTGATITATTFSGSGASLTSLNASSIASGTVPTARLASGTADSGTYLRGDSTWAALAAPNNGTLTMGTSGTGISGSATFTANQAGASTFTITSNATSANGASSIVARDASGNFTANNITANGDVTSSSDERLKTDWRAVVYDFVEKLANVKSGVYTRIDTGETQIGASAQSLASVIPEATKVGEDGMMSIAYGQAALVATVELAKYVAELKKEIDLLKAK
jgi:hypothetical protein